MGGDSEKGSRGLTRASSPATDGRPSVAPWRLEHATDGERFDDHYVDVPGNCHYVKIIEGDSVAAFVLGRSAAACDRRKHLMLAAPDMLDALRPFLPAYHAYVDATRGFQVTGDTLADRHASESERRATAEESAHDALAAVSYIELQAVFAALDKATVGSAPPSDEGGSTNTTPSISPPPPSSKERA